MKNISSIIGYWSAISLLVFFITWIVCFVGIAVTSPLFYWNGLPHYLAYIASNNQTFADVAKIAMLFFGPAYLLFIHSFYDCASEKQRPLLRMALLFALAFTITSSMHYFVQVTSVKFSIQNNLTEGLVHFLQANPYSFLLSVNMLGWTIFLGFSSLFVALSFTLDHSNKKLKFTFLILFFSCLGAAIGYGMQNKWMIFLFVNIGTGGFLLAVSFNSLRYFRSL